MTRAIDPRFKARALARSAAAWAALAAFFGATLVASTQSACTTHQCDPDMVCLAPDGTICGTTTTAADSPAHGGGVRGEGGTGGIGGPLGYRSSFYYNGDEIVWQSSPLEGPWLDFPGQRTYEIILPDAFAQADPGTFDFSVLVSYDNPQELDASHANFTPAAGQLVEFGNVIPTQVDASGKVVISALNATCVDLSVRIVVRAELTGSADAGAGSAESGADDTGAE